MPNTSKLDEYNKGRWLNEYTVEARWQWFSKNRLRVDGGLSAEALESLKAVFFIGFGEACDLFDTVGGSDASEDECGEFFVRIQTEVQAFHLNRAPTLGGRQ